MGRHHVRANMDDHPEAREGLVERLRAAGELRSARVADAVRRVPREAFVPDDRRDRAYEDAAIDIGHGQVSTAPHLVARMTELLSLSPGDAVLEVGTGGGYHAAVMAEICGGENLATIEREPDLAERARRNLARTDYDEVSVVVGDGSRGLPRGAPYDRINVACAAPAVPDPLARQLSDGGRMTIPLGRDPGGSHTLYLVRKRGDRLDRTPHGPVKFVPLVGAYGFADGD